MARARTIGWSALALAVVGAVGAGVLLAGTSAVGRPLDPEPRLHAPATRAELEAASARRVFFGHQSVGKNVLAGVPAVYAEAGLPAPEVVDLGSGSSLPGPGPVLAHAYIGQNGDPLGKIRDFDARLRGGLGGQVDVAAMKLCYLDITGATDLDEVFTTYRDTLAALTRDYPEIRFVHVTTPVKTEPVDLKWRAKEVLGRANDNAARERYNALMRTEYAGADLLDLAAIEATGPDGVLTTVPHDGRQHLALDPAWAHDPGHLNAAGSKVAAAHFLALVGRTP